jgi:hypothetical protein
VRKDAVLLWRSDFITGGVAALKASIAPGPPAAKSEAALRVATPAWKNLWPTGRNWTIPRLHAEIKARDLCAANCRAILNTIDCYVSK